MRKKRRRGGEEDLVWLACGCGQEEQEEQGSMRGQEAQGWGEEQVRQLKREEGDHTSSRVEGELEEVEEAIIASKVGGMNTSFPSIFPPACRLGAKISSICSSICSRRDKHVEVERHK